MLGRRPVEYWTGSEQNIGQEASKMLRQQNIRQKKSRISPRRTAGILNRGPTQDCLREQQNIGQKKSRISPRKTAEFRTHKID
jgi:hypothetical protein